jgi:hypothetical protein
MRLNNSRYHHLLLLHGLQSWLVRCCCHTRRTRGRLHALAAAGGERVMLLLLLCSYDHCWRISGLHLPSSLRYVTHVMTYCTT